jgi:hypothetical protein
VRPRGLLLALVLALTGCGTTVPAAQQLGTSAEGGLAPQPAAGGPVGVPGRLRSGIAPGAATGGVPGAASGATVGSSATRAPAGPVTNLPADRVSRPISIGVLSQGAANTAAAALGANYSTSTSGADVSRALVRWFNKNGGIAGRRISPVEYVIEATSPNYQTDMQAACARFTQDNHVAAVVSVLANAYFATYESCLSKAGVPDIAGPTGGTDEHDLAAYPGLVSVTAPSTDRRFEVMLDRFAASGYLKAGGKVGIIVETCDYNHRAYDATVVPVARRLGLSLTRRDVDCVTGFADAANYINQVGTAVLPFRSAGIDRVTFLSNFEGVGLLAFENNANSQGYTPSYALTSTTGGAALAGQFSETQLTRMRGVGWTPVLDVARRVLPSATTKRCRDALKSEGIVPQSKADDLLDLVCDQFFLLEAVLKATQGHAERDTLRAGLRSLQSSYVSAYTLGSGFGSRRDGPRLFAIWGYKSACGCMDYLSAATAG